MEGKNIIKKSTFYGAWEYKKEETDLNTASKNGLQLIKGGCFHSVFCRDDSVRYIYQLDFQPKLPDITRYTETFQDGGWEYINSTHNGWHYFRRPYEEGMEVESLKIYSDHPSLFQMENRWYRIIRFAAVFLLLMSVVYAVIALSKGVTTSSYSILLLTYSFVFLAFSLTFFSAWRCVYRSRKGLETHLLLPLQIIWPVGFAIIIGISIIGFLI